MKKKVVVVGSGAREHSIVLKLLHSVHVEKVYAIPGNPGIALCDQNRVVILGKWMSDRSDCQRYPSSVINIQ